MKENTEIIKVGFGPKKLTVKYATLENDSLRNHSVEFNIKSEYVHPDFIKAMRSLDKHLHGALMIGTDYLDRVVAEGIEVEQKDEQDSVKILGKVTLESNNLVKINTDYMRLEPDEYLYNYEKADEIAIDVNTVRAEAYKYIFEGKRAQQQLPFKEVEEVEPTNEEPDEGLFCEENKEDEKCEKEIYPKKDIAEMGAELTN